MPHSINNNFEIQNHLNILINPNLKQETKSQLLLNFI